jgi:hypothetical protein
MAMLTLIQMRVVIVVMDMMMLLGLVVMALVIVVQVKDKNDIATEDGDPPRLGLSVGQKPKDRKFQLVVCVSPCYSFILHPVSGGKNCC